MKFRLTFSGSLPGSGGRSGNAAAEKWYIRKQIHPQLEELWRVHPVLSQDPKFAMWSTGAARVPTMNRARTPKEVLGYHFLPLVRKELNLMCDLDIVFMRKGEPGSLFLPDGDLDKRIRTLFDGLKVPEQSDFSAGRPDEGIDPFYCLMEDDSLVSGFAVHTDRLLTGPHGKDTDVLLVVDVTVRVMQITATNISLLGH